MSELATIKPQDKAIGKSISFYPSKLFERLETFASKPSVNRSPSSIVCEAVTEYLAKNDPQPDDATTAALAQVQAAAAKDDTLAGDILQFIRDRKRKSRSGR